MSDELIGKIEACGSCFLKQTELVRMAQKQVQRGGSNRGGDRKGDRESSRPSSWGNGHATEQ